MTTTQTAGRPLSALSEDERYRVFDTLQPTMASVWEAMRRDYDDESVVVVPSISIDKPGGSGGTIMQAMEERALFLLLLLRQPRLRMIYVTSQPISESTVEYYLGSAARGDPQPRPGPAHPAVGRRLLARAAERETACAAQASANDPLLGAESGQKPSDSLQHHTARTRCRAVPGHPDVRRATRAWPTWAPRPVAVACSRNSV